jgi:UDP-glucose:(heptosyl)LPS alpha-1,3-glucosyltransferase
MGPAGGALSVAENSALKIAVVRPYFTRSKGGAERYAVELAQGLVALGHSVHVFAHRWDSPEESGVTYHSVSMLRKPAWLRVLLFNRNVRRLLKFSDYDVVLGMTPYWPQSVFWLGDGLYDVWTRIAWPSTVLRRIMCLKRAVMAVNLRLEKKVLSGATEHFIANSQLVKRQAMRHYGVPESRISVVYPGIDTQRFNLDARRRAREEMRRTLSLHGGDVALLFASNNFKRKGLDVVIRALAGSENRARLRLLVVGAGRVGRFRRLAQRCKVADRIIFAGPTQAIEDYYAAADVLVLPTLYDPFAAVCLEAMACGLPVITTRMNGAAEVISEGENGFLLAPRDMERRLSACLQLLPTVEQCAQLGLNAARIAANYPMRDHVQRIASVLGECAAHGPTRQRLRLVQPSPEMVVNENFLPLLEKYGLASFSALVDSAMATKLSYNRDKQIYFLALGEGKERQSFFLKRHLSRCSWFQRLCAGGNLRAQSSEGMREWQNILEFRARGLPSIVPVAAGQRMLPSQRIESFVLTLRLDGFLPLDDYVLTRLASYPPSQAAKRRRLLVSAVARLTREMHGLGFNHRDFYLCHIFIKDEDRMPPELRIIDLQRLGIRRRPARRWRIKDLAQLHFSSLAIPVTEWDRLRFFALYAPPGGDRRERRRIITRVLRKSRSIARHHAQIRVRDGDENAVDPFKASAHLLNSPSAHDRIFP